MKAYDENELYAMSNETLRKIYKKITVTQKRFSRFAVFLSIPCVFFFFFFGWQLLKELRIPILTKIFDCSVTGWLDFVIFGICGITLTTNDENFLIFVPIIYGVLAFLKYICFGSFALINIIMLAYFCLAAVMLYNALKTLKLLKGMRNFPFNRRFD